MVDPKSNMTGILIRKKDRCRDSGSKSTEHLFVRKEVWVEKEFTIFQLAKVPEALGGFFSSTGAEEKAEIKLPLKLQNANPEQVMWESIRSWNSSQKDLTSEWSVGKNLSCLGNNITSETNFTACRSRWRLSGLWSSDKILYNPIGLIQCQDQQFFSPH